MKKFVVTVIFGRLTFDKCVEGIARDLDITHDESVWPEAVPTLTQKEKILRTRFQRRDAPLNSIFQKFRPPCSLRRPLGMLPK